MLRGQLQLACGASLGLHLGTMISEQEVARVAHLSRLSLTQEEIQKLASQLSGVLAAFEKVAKVPTEGVEPLVTPTEMQEHWREDHIEKWENAAGALKGAPETVGNLFKVPPVVG